MSDSDFAGDRIPVIPARVEAQGASGIVPYLLSRWKMLVAANLFDEPRPDRVETNALRAHVFLTMPPERGTARELADLPLTSGPLALSQGLAKDRGEESLSELDQPPGRFAA